MYQSNNKKLERNNIITTSEDLCNRKNDDRMGKLMSSTPQNLKKICSSQSDLNKENISDIEWFDNTSSPDIQYDNLNTVAVNDSVQEVQNYPSRQVLNFSPSATGNISLIHSGSLVEDNLINSDVYKNGKTVLRNTPEDAEYEKSLSSEALPSFHPESITHQQDPKCSEDRDDKSEYESQSLVCSNKKEHNSQSSICSDGIDDLCQKSSNYYHLVTQSTTSSELENTTSLENAHCSYHTSEPVTDVSHPTSNLDKSKCNYSSEAVSPTGVAQSQNQIPESKKNYWWELPISSDINTVSNCETSCQSELSIPPSWWDSSDQSRTSEICAANNISCDQAGLDNSKRKLNEEYLVSLNNKNIEIKNDAEQKPLEYGTLQDSRQDAVVCCGNEIKSSQQNYSVRPRVYKETSVNPPWNGNDNLETLKNIEVTNDIRYPSSECPGTVNDNSQDSSIYSGTRSNYSKEIECSQGSNVPSRFPYHFQNPELLFRERNIQNPASIPKNILNQNQQTNMHSKTERTRRRSGSWTGVDESDDEVEEISRENQNTIDLSQAFDDFNDPQVVGTRELQSSLQSSYHNSINSCRSVSEGMVPHLEEFIDEEEIKRRLKFFFMNPLEKFQARKRFPWKLLVQIMKVIICTIQLGMFASQRYSHVTYLWDTKVSLSHLFIKSWDSTREVVAYPPSTGPLAVYTIKEFYSFIDFSVHSFVEIETTAVGAYKYQRRKDEEIVMPNFCITKYKSGYSDVSNLAFNLSKSIRTECFPVPLTVLNDTKEFSIQEYLEVRNKTINFDLLLESSFSFNLETVKLRSDFPYETPECYRLETLIYYDNNDHDGQMLIDLDIGAKVLDCEGNLTDSASYPGVDPFRTTLNVSTISVCMISLILCLRALFRGQLLKRLVNSCFKYRFQRELSRWESFEFVNLWYVLICINDFLIIVGSVIKMSLEGQDYEGYLDKWNVCSLLLGTGNLLIWFGCLRYLGFFETYNVLILTMKHCIPNVCRYSICTLMVFAGYSLCGWLVLGPYHIKFRSLSTTFECLFSLINGDDMFATFSSTIGKDYIVWWFSRIYIYSFTSLFIYVILSLAIAIITDTYYTVQTWYKVGYPETELRKYAASSKADAANGDFYDTGNTFKDLLGPIFCCCCFQRCTSRQSAGYERIPSDLD